jgi:hypothetical protein
MKAVSVFKLYTLATLLITINIHSLSAQKNDNWLEGIWEGTGQQSGGQSWAMRLTVSANSYIIEYPSLGCRGVWNLVDINSKKARFVERVSSSRSCADFGNVSVERINDEQIKFSYSMSNTNIIIATATLQKSRTAKPIENKQKADGSSTQKAESDFPQTTDPLHNSGAKLLETESYAVYKHRPYYKNLQSFDDRFCGKYFADRTKNEVRINIVHKVNSDYVITDDKEYRRRFEEEIFPAIKGQCGNIAVVFIFNYIYGVRINHTGQDFGYGQQLPKGFQEWALNTIDVYPEQNQFRYEPHTKDSESARTYASLSSLRGLLASRQAKLDKLDKEAGIRAKEEEADRADLRQRAAAGGFSTKALKYEELFAKIFLGEFNETPTHRESSGFGTFYARYLDFYARHCGENLPKNNRIEITEEVCRRWGYTRFSNGVETPEVCIESYTRGTKRYVDPDMYEASLVLKLFQPVNVALLIDDITRSPGKVISDMVTNAFDVKSDMENLFKANACSSPVLIRFQENLRRFALNENPLPDLLPSTKPRPRTSLAKAVERYLKSRASVNIPNETLASAADFIAGRFQKIPLEPGDKNNFLSGTGEQEIFLLWMAYQYTSGNLISQTTKNQMQRFLDEIISEDPLLFAALNCASCPRPPQPEEHPPGFAARFLRPRANRASALSNELLVQPQRFEGLIDHPLEMRLQWRSELPKNLDGRLLKCEYLPDDNTMGTRSLRYYWYRATPAGWTQTSRSLSRNHPLLTDVGAPRDSCPDRW